MSHLCSVEAKFCALERVWESEFQCEIWASSGKARKNMSMPGRAPGTAVLRFIKTTFCGSFWSDRFCWSRQIQWHKKCVIFIYVYRRVFVCRYVHESAGAPKGHDRGSGPWSCIIDSCELSHVDTEDPTWVLWKSNPHSLLSDNRFCLHAFFLNCTNLRLHLLLGD